MKTVIVGGRTWTIGNPGEAITPEMEQAAMRQISAIVGAGCGSCASNPQSTLPTLAPATCPGSITQGTSHQFTINAASGTPPYKYTLVVDGAPKPGYQNIAFIGNSATFNYVFNESAGTHSYGIYITDSCPSGSQQSPVDACTVSITAVSATGSIVCSTTPAGAQIWLDGVNTGIVTPNTLTNVTAAGHTVTFKLAGYLDCVVNVTVPAAGSVNASCTLTPACVTPNCSIQLV